MATTYYVDPAHGGTDSGTLTNPWTSLQSAADTAVAGDTVYCTGTQTLAAAIDFDTNSGDTTAGFIKFIGCDASWTPKAAQFTLDGNSAATSCIALTCNYVWFESFTATGATSNGIYRADASSCLVFVDCISESNGAGGFSLYAIQQLLLIRCIARNNGGHGFADVYSNVTCFGCYFYNNTGMGVQQGPGRYSLCLLGCVVACNGSTQVDIGLTGILLNCVIDGEDDTTSGSGVLLSGSLTAVLGCRITHNDAAGKYGIESAAAASCCVENWNAFYDNTTHIDTGIESLGDSDTSMADDGYAARATQDYNVATGKDLRSVAVEVT